MSKPVDPGLAAIDELQGIVDGVSDRLTHRLRDVIARMRIEQREGLSIELRHKIGLSHSQVSEAKRIMAELPMNEDRPRALQRLRELGLTSHQAREAAELIERLDSSPRKRASRLAGMRHHLSGTISRLHSLLANANGNSDADAVVRCDRITAIIGRLDELAERLDELSE